MTPSKTTKLYIVRHGQSEANIRHIVGGDFELTETGREQVRKTTNLLKHLPFSCIYSTGLKRTWSTGEILRNGKSIPHRIHPGLRERHYGIHENTDGKEYTRLYAKRNQMAETLPEDKRRNYRTYPSYENDADLMKRYLEGLREIATRHLGEHVIVASHGSAMRVLLIYLNHIPRAKLDYGAVENAAHIIIDSDGHELTIEDAVGITVRI